MRLSFFVFLIGFFSCFLIQAQNNLPHHYVVVGVFAKQENALRFAEKANKSNLTAQYAINPDRNLYYVYVLDTEDRRKAYTFLMKIRVETEFREAWIFSGQLGTESIKEEIKKVEPEVKQEPVRVKEEPIVEPVKEEIKRDSIVTPAVVKVDSSAAKAEVKTKPEGKPFLFKLTNGKTGEDVSGEVHIMTSAKAGQYQSFPVNKVVYIKAVKGAVLQVTTVAPGYKEMKRSVNYNDPATSAAVVGAEEEAVVTFPLVGVNFGDYIEFSNVHFFQNSAILQPESKDELDGLADLMKENLKYKIKIHGHCNGTRTRDIVSKGTSTNFFATEEGNVKESASAKRLTEFRADIVRDYLISQGVEAGRISTKAEGGKAAIYPSNSTHASRNDRVEVEITKGK